MITYFSKFFIYIISFNPLERPVKWCHYSPHFWDEKSQAQRGCNTCSKPHSWQVTEPEYKPGKQTRESDLTYSILLAQKTVSTLSFLFHESVVWQEGHGSWVMRAGSSSAPKWFRKYIKEGIGVHELKVLFCLNVDGLITHRPLHHTGFVFRPNSVILLLQPTMHSQGSQLASFSAERKLSQGSTCPSPGCILFYLYHYH